MSANQTFESVLSTIKCSNLNFHLQQSPFSAVICIKKSLIKDKYGNHLVPPLPDSETIIMLRAENQTLGKKVTQLENTIITLKGNLEDTISDSEKKYTTIKLLENDLDSAKNKLKVKAEVSKADLDKKTNQIETLTVMNNSLENENIETKEFAKKIKNDLEGQLHNKEKALKQNVVMSEKLEKTVDKLEIEKNELSIKLSEIEKIKVAPPTKTSKSTNTVCFKVTSTASQSEINSPDANTSFCLHSGCFIRHPHNPPPPSCHQKNSYTPPPSNIRLLPRSVESCKAYRSLQIIHECEECEEGALFNNYYEMVEYPATGPSGGTSGSPVTICPNNPQAYITLLTKSTENKRIYRKRNIACKLCDQKFLEKTNLIFHTNRVHHMI